MFIGLLIVYIVDIKYLTCHVTFQDHLVKGSCDFIEESSPFYVANIPSLVDIASGHCGSGDITYLICLETLQDHVIKESYDLMEGDPSLYATTLPGLMAN